MSVTIAGSPYYVWRWPKPKITPSIQWVQDSAGYWNASDRGASQDAYETTCTFLDKETTLNALEAALDANREGVTLSAFAAPLFSPNVNHTGSISATVLSRSRKHVQWGVPKATSQLYALDVTFRAISPTLLSTTPSLATLKLQAGYTGEASYTSPKAFSYSQTAYYADEAADVGHFKGVFRQTEAQLKAILGYLLVTARGSSFAFPNIGVAFPFGFSRGVYSSKSCKVYSFSISRQDFVFWNLELELVEA